MCLHASWMDPKFCTRCNPPAKAPPKAPVAKRPALDPGEATPTADIDPESVPAFTEDDPRGLLHDALMHRRGTGSHATVKVRDHEGRALNTSVPRALWARAVSEGLRDQHAGETDDIVHSFVGCPAEVVNEHGCRYNCTNIQHYRLRRRPKQIGARLQSVQ